MNSSNYRPLFMKSMEYDVLAVFFSLLYLPQKQIHWLVLKKNATSESTYPSNSSNYNSIITGVYAVLVEDGVTNKVVQDALDYFAKNR